MRTLLLATICLTICSLTLGHGAVLADDQGTIVPDEWKALHDRWQAMMDEFQVPGMAIVVVQGDQVVVLDAIGACDPAGKQRVTPRSPFYLASVTKSFTALGVAILVDEGKVKLDEPVKTYLPRFALADPDLAAKITVRDLLCHRYGLNSEPIGMGEAYFGNMTDDRYYRLLATVEPRSKFSYTNLHYTLAGRIIEAVTGQSWQDFLAERVFAPLEMRDSTCYASQLYANSLAAWPLAVRDGKLQKAAVVKTDSVMHAAGGMGASAADLANWLRFQLTGKTPRGTQLISTELLKEMQTRQVTSEQIPGDKQKVVRDGYALGWFTGSFLGHRMLEHGGGYVGTATNVSFLPEEKIGVAVLVNQSRGAIPLLVVRDVYSKLLGVEAPDLLPDLRKAIADREKRIAAAAPQRKWQPPGAGRGLSQSVDKYAGQYENAVWGAARIEVPDNTLRLQVGDLALRLHALGDDRFELEIPPGDITKGEFEIDSDGNVDGFSVATPVGKARFQKTK